mgnify:CR=1 FL=1
MSSQEAVEERSEDARQDVTPERATVQSEELLPTAALLSKTPPKITLKQFFFTLADVFCLLAQYFDGAMPDYEALVEGLRPYQHLRPVEENNEGDLPAVIINKDADVEYPEGEEEMVEWEHGGDTSGEGDVEAITLYDTEDSDDQRHPRFMCCVYWTLVVINSSLRGAGQVVFMNSPVTGIAILTAYFLHDRWLACCALLGVLSATTSALGLSFKGTAIREGLFGYNGLLLGASLGYFLDARWSWRVAALVFCRPA